MPTKKTTKAAPAKAPARAKAKTPTKTKRAPAPKRKRARRSKQQMMQMQLPDGTMVLGVPMALEDLPLQLLAPMLFHCPNCSNIAVELAAKTSTEVYRLVMRTIRAVTSKHSRDAPGTSAAIIGAVSGAIAAMTAIHHATEPTEHEAHAVPIYSKGITAAFLSSVPDIDREEQERDKAIAEGVPPPVPVPAPAPSKN